jgi:hypothetical protein
VQWTYACPHCNAMLNPDETVILIGVQNDLRVLVGFHPMPGRYQAHVPPGLEVQTGAHWDFFCPLCLQNLVTEAAPDLCALDMVTQNQRHRLFFSRIAGDEATFVISAEGIERFGRDHEGHSLEILDLV